jgi:hypothetical protein
MFNENNIKSEMDDNKLENVSMTADELADFNKFRAEQRKKQEALELIQKKAVYEELVEDILRQAVFRLTAISASLSAEKRRVYDDFNAVIATKDEIFGLKEGQRSNTFTSKDGKTRLILGYNTIDAYSDTAEIGIAKVKEFMISLIDGDKTRALVNQINSLMAKDQKGNLKPSRVAQLSKLANELQSEELQEAVRFITDAYAPQLSKQFVRLQIKNGLNEWKDVPLGMTEA